MSIRELRKKQDSERAIDQFISKGGSVTPDSQTPKDFQIICLRIPKTLLERIDTKRKERVARISRTLFIVELLEREFSQ